MVNEGGIMTDHADLVAEQVQLERLSAQERLKLARRRRMQQLKQWGLRDKEIRRRKTESQNAKGFKVHFEPSVMLLEAAARNDIDEVRRLLLLGVSPDSTNEDGLTALHQCCIDDSPDIMRLLVDFGADTNAKDSESWSPLHAASTCGHIHLVKYLIEKGANLLAVNADGNMPYDICEDEMCLDLIENEMSKSGITQELIDDVRSTTERQMLTDIKWLSENRCYLEFKDSQGATPLHIASANGYLSVVEYLLTCSVSCEAVDNDLWQPIHAAACWSHPEAVEMLVQNGADLDAKTKNGETPYDICEDPELREKILQLKEAKILSNNPKATRTHSQNTHCQSVRRTSIREKNLISRREAREEALIWQEKQNTVGGDENNGENEVKIQMDSETKESSFNLDDLSLSVMNAKDTIQRLKGKTEDIHIKSKEGSEGVTVEIHLTVNTYNPNPGTLADLKRQRADLRKRNNFSPPQLENGVSSSPYRYEPPASPSISLRKFRSDPSEIVGADVKSLDCCSII